LILFLKYVIKSILMKFIQSCFVLCFSSFLSTASYGMLAGESTPILPLLPAYLHDESKIALYGQIVSQEVALGKQLVVGEKSLYGFSFPGISKFDAEILTYIRERFDQLNEGVMDGKYKRPRVLDGGAGYGFLSWKLIASGANLVAIELQQNAAKKMQQAGIHAKPFLGSGEQLKDVFRPIRGDVSQSRILFPDVSHTAAPKFDVVVLRNVLHVMTPSQIKATLRGVSQVLAPGGRVFISANALSTFKQEVSLGSEERNAADRARLVAAFYQNKRESKEFPGYLEKVTEFELKFSREISARITGIRHLGDENVDLGEALPSERGIAVGQKLTKTKALHVFDPDVICKLLDTYGIKVVSARLSDGHMDVDPKDIDEGFDYMQTAFQVQVIGVKVAD
jgi:SAM-dependent methyltransferase